MTNSTLLLGFCISVFSCTQTNTKKQTTIELNQIDSIQYINQVIQFVKQLKRQELDDSLFILEDEPSTLDYYDCLQSIFSDTVTFSKTEINIIKKESKKPILKTWTNSLIPNIKIVSADTIRAVFKDNSKGWEYFYKHIGRSISGFSPPIFLRHFSYCVFYSENNCGRLCGEGYLTLYKKEKDKWIAIKSYCRWVS